MTLMNPAMLAVIWEEDNISALKECRKSLFKHKPPLPESASTYEPLTPLVGKTWTVLNVTDWFHVPSYARLSPGVLWKALKGEPFHIQALGEKNISTQYAR